MYESILVPVDNSDFSNRAIDVAIGLGQKFGSKMTGNHVYAAKMHDYRFKQMEFTLPDEYLQEQELDKQRKIHDSLITMGLKLISDCYLHDMDEKCQAAGLEMERKMMDGKHHVELLKDMQESNYDLTVLGVLGIGKMRDSQIGAVASNVTRQGKKDVWLVKHIPTDEESDRDTILVGIDGSPQSFGGLMTAIDLAVRYNKKITLIGVYDPYLHYQVFNGLVDVLTDQAAKVFRFEEQNQLHEEVIDTGLAQIYQSHLEVAEQMIQSAHGDAIDIEKVLLDGKAFQKIVDYARKNPPWVLVIGRVGVHGEEDDELGSNSENLIRLAPCDVLLTTRLEHPELDRKAEESILWTAEATERMTKVPDLVKGIARTAILRLAVEQGHSVVSNDLIDEAMDRFMPKQTSQATAKLAETLAFNQARKGNTALCKKCGVTAAEANPVKCAVCGSSEFEKITTEMIDAIVNAEGGSEEEETYDGRRLKWTNESRDVLRAIKDAYQKRRAKAYIEKTARVKKLDTVSREFAEQVLADIGHADKLAAQAKEDEQPEADGLSAAEKERGLQIVARDKKGVPLKSVFPYSEEASARILRVPAGFMRDRTQDKVEELALDDKHTQIDLDLVERGIEIGRQVMEEMIKAQGSGTKPEYKTVDGKPDYEANQPPKKNMNEVGVMSELDKKRSGQ